MVTVREHTERNSALELSVIIPAWNEAAFLPKTLDALAGAGRDAGLTLEVIVVNNASTDATRDVARAHGVRVVDEPERRIAAVRNAGAAAARAPWLLFLDADTGVTREHLSAVADALSDGYAGGGAPIAFDAPVPRFYTAGVVVWNALARRLKLAAGSFVFARADLHRAVGGFDGRAYAGEELGYSRALRRQGRRYGLDFGVLVTAPVVSSARKTQWYAPWQHALVLVTFLLFPWAGRFRRLTWFWYLRPKQHAERR